MGSKFRYSVSTQLLQSTDFYDRLFFKVCKWGLRVAKTGCRGNRKTKLKYARGNKKNWIYHFITTRQLNVQQVFYNVLPELWLRKRLSGISFINTNLPQNRIRMIKSKEEIKELPGDCTVIFKCNIVDRYIDHSVCGNFACLKNALLVKFASCYYKKVFLKKITNQVILEKTSAIRILIFP